MKRLILATSALCLASVGALPTAAQNFGQNQGLKFVDHTLLVEAQGVYITDPDLATLTFDINSQDKQLASAYDKATKSMQHILAIAEQNGLSKNDVEFGALTLAPNYNGGRKAHGYLVQGQMTVRIRDFAKIGPILDASVQEGVVDSRSLTYSLENEEAAKEKAVAQAVRDAVGRA
ncbi:MAG TPA: SIMPL domain-containing protein [Candidatus Acidoferrales bacterium]|nr:SIMPL domain-containing protein [Candidatus Acidoferrales bacterium]